MLAMGSGEGLEAGRMALHLDPLHRREVGTHVSFQRVAHEREGRVRRALVRRDGL